MDKKIINPDTSKEYSNNQKKAQFKTYYLKDNMNQHIKTIKFIQLINSIVERKNGLNLSQIKILNVKAIKQYSKLPLEDIIGLSDVKNITSEIETRYKEYQTRLKKERLEKAFEELQNKKTA